jgi:hypothetical protein
LAYFRAVVVLAVVAANQGVARFCLCCQVVSRLGIFGSRHLYLVPRLLMSVHPSFDEVVRGILVADSKAEVMLLYEASQEVCSAPRSSTCASEHCVIASAGVGNSCHPALNLCGVVCGKRDGLLSFACKQGTPACAIPFHNSCACCAPVCSAPLPRLPRQLWLEKLRRRMKRDAAISASFRRVRFVRKLPERDILVLMKVADVIVDTFPVGMGVTALEA